MQLDDIEYDSLYFYTTDDVTIAVYNTPWMSIPDEMRSVDLPSSYRTVYNVSCPVGFEPNTTGRPRSGSITVTADAPYGNLGELQASLPDKAYLGDRLTLHFSPLEHAESYSYWIHDEWNGEWRMGESRSSAGDLIIDTSRLESGVYWVELDADALGYTQSHSVLHFALLDKNDIEYSTGGRYFTISSLEIPTELGAHIVAYLPGAERIRLYQQRNDGIVEEYEEREGPGLSTGFGSGNAGEYSFWLSGCFAGAWTEPEKICTLTVTSTGQLDPPALTVNGTTEGLIVADVIFPSYTVNANEASVTLYLVPVAVSVNVTVSISAAAVGTKRDSESDGSITTWLR